MKVHLIKKQTIEDYVKRQARSRSSFAHWLTILHYAEYDQLCAKSQQYTMNMY